MHYHTDIKAEVNERPQTHGPAIFEVLVYAGDSDELIYESSHLYRRRYQAEAQKNKVDGELFAVRCAWCKVSADYIEFIEDIGSDVDVTAWCSEECREESKREDADLARAGL